MYTHTHLLHPCSSCLREPPRDRDKLASLARAPFVSDSDHYQDEIELMLAGGFKMELEALSWLGVDYLSNCWLEPAMLTGDYL